MHMQRQNLPPATEADMPVRATEIRLPVPAARDRREGIQ